MGIEFRMTLSVEEVVSDAGDFQLVSSRFEQTIPVKLFIIDDSPSGRMYAFGMPFRSKWPEDFVMQLQGQEWYLCFYSAIASQQNTVLQTLTRCLHGLGVTGNFEEL